MKKYIAIGLIAAGIGFAGAAQARDLTVVSWGGIFQDAQRQVYFDPFKKETGLPLVEDSWDGGVGILRSKVSAGDANNWDIVEVESDELTVGCEEGLFAKLDFAKLGPVDRYLPGTAGGCGVPANIFSIVIAYDTDKLSDGPKNWTDFWDVKKFPGKRALRKGAKMNLEFALMADGVKTADVYKVLATPEGVDRAFAKLDQLKPQIVWWTSGNQPMQLLGSGEVTMTTSYHTRIGAANKGDGRHFKIVWPGSMFNTDSWVMLKTSPNADAANKLLSVLERTDTNAKWPEKLGGGTAVIEAQKLIAPELASGLPTSPENMKEALTLDAPFWVANIDKLNERFEAWAGK